MPYGVAARGCTRRSPLKKVSQMLAHKEQVPAAQASGQN